MNFRKLTITFAAAAILASFASSADAASRLRQDTPGFNAFGAAPFSDSVGIDGARARALQECSGSLAGVRDYTWGVQVGDRYRACMTEHGQPE